MRRAATILAMLAALIAGAAEEVFAGREWHRLTADQAGRLDAIRERDDREQVITLFYAFPEKMVGIKYQQTVIPGEPDKPILERHGDSHLSYRGRARWGWSFENFHHPRVVLVQEDGAEIEMRPGILAAHELTPAQAQAVSSRSHGWLEALNVLQSEGERVMGDFVWPIEHAGAIIGRLVLRCVIRADEPNWLYAQTFVCGDERLRLRQLGLSSFGGAAGPRPPGQEQWFAGLTSHDPVPQRHSVLPWEEYWFVAAHKKGWDPYDRRGSTGIFLEADAPTLRYGAHGGGVTLELGPDARAVRCALSDFLDGAREPAAQIADLREQAPARRRRLLEMDWQPPWEAELARLKVAADTVARDLPRDQPPLADWLADYHLAVVAAKAARDRGATSAEAVVAGTRLQQLRLDLDSMRAGAVQTLIEQVQED